ncbi:MULTISPECIES: hypothetical protein [Stenotrophomonas]|uniref:hypothetical protein n=1 Tax=Stenotrophomonas TaxID=40323 RepID=UPI000ACC0759|nr:MULTISPECIES: hypothetical protein [Stenotrophomonas]
MTEDELAGMAALLSAERLAAFVQLTGTERDALNVHDSTIQVASALVPVMCLVEIAVRNAVNERLRSVFGTHDWLIQPPAPFAWKPSEHDKVKDARRQAQRAAYTKLTDNARRSLDSIAFPNGVPAGTKHEKRVKRRQETIAIAHGQLIAQLTMFFWKRLFAADYEDALWKRGLKELFPKKTVKRGDVADHLEVVYQARNRIAHHEPIHGARLGRLLSSLDFLVLNLGNKSGDESSPLARLTVAHRTRLREVSEESSALFATFVVQPASVV